MTETTKAFLLKWWPWMFSVSWIVICALLLLFPPEKGRRLKRVIEIYDDGTREVHEMEDYYEGDNDPRY